MTLLFLQIVMRVIQNRQVTWKVRSTGNSVKKRMTEGAPGKWAWWEGKGHSRSTTIECMVGELVGGEGGRLHAQVANTMHRSAGYMHKLLVACTNRWLHARVDGYVNRSMVTCTGRWLHAQFAGYIHRSLLTCTIRWLHAQVAGYIHSSLVTYTGRWLHAQVAGYMHRSLVTCTGRW